mmetsp:Transcript_83280/g.185078  ORF Transcript_83280/g.185078 Transcript_83280/m.185078 type:complete len:139 (+) Transcript_83280:35-451(+)
MEGKSEWELDLTRSPRISGPHGACSLRPAALLGPALPHGGTLRRTAAPGDADAAQGACEGAQDTAAEVAHHLHMAALGGHAHGPMARRVTLQKAAAVFAEHTHHLEVALACSADERRAALSVSPVPICAQLTEQAHHL